MLLKVVEWITLCFGLFVCQSLNLCLVPAVSHRELSRTQKSLMPYHWIYSVIHSVTIIVFTVILEHHLMKTNYALDFHQKRMKLLHLVENTWKISVGPWYVLIRLISNQFSLESHHRIHFQPKVVIQEWFIVAFLLMLHRCWWLMRENICVGDNYNHLLSLKSSFLPSASGTNISKIPPILTLGHQHDFW